MGSVEGDFDAPDFPGSDPSASCGLAQAKNVGDFVLQDPFAVQMTPAQSDPQQRENPTVLWLLDSNYFREIRASKT